MNLNFSLRVYKIIAGVSLSLLLVVGLGFLGYWLLWPRLNAGVQALQYLEACIEAEICPNGTLVSQKITEKRAKVAAAAAPAAVASPSAPAPSPQPPEKK